jgi:hypothetical protein
MKTKQRDRAVVLVGLLFLGGISVTLVLTFNVGSVSHPGISGQGQGELAQSVDSFSITGDASDPILPGSRTPTDLTIINTHDSDLVVTQLNVTVIRVDAPNANADQPCSIHDFTIDQTDSTLNFTVSPTASQSLSQLGIPESAWPRLGMRDTSANQDGCKGASLTLAYAASGKVEKK